MRLNRKLWMVLVFTITGFVVTYMYRAQINNYLYSLTYQKPENLQFKVNNCDEDIDPYTPSNRGIQSIEWLQENTLEIKTINAMLCGGQSLRYPDYKIEGNNLILEYTIITDSVTTSCMCSKEIRYTISELPKKDYTISLRIKN